ncbi:PA2169 family four-helix-bundle protein [Sphingomonas montana]|uniref:PA2169 family four-helix-bundle protein n=1 Tax=Sphingomonas montana TaxID=1843236 RepID=UPI00097018C0|nr:PA2169 family four-helix-bundle protein [Sphingomonas montana]
MVDTSHDIRTLNGLIATVIDSAEGYSESAKDIEGGRFGAIFTSRAAERRQVAASLQGEVVRLGGNPEDDGTILASAHRLFVNLKSTVTGSDDKAIVDEVERGEDHIKAKFEAAMQDGDVSPQVQSVIKDAYASVRQGHDQMRDIKHAMEGQA